MALGKLLAFGFDTDGCPTLAVVRQSVVVRGALGIGLATVMTSVSIRAPQTCVMSCVSSKPSRGGTINVPILQILSEADGATLHL